jgi:type III pantothenate kinase
VTEVVATGGLAPVVLSECATVTRHEPMLTLIGLQLVYARNAPGSRPGRS